MSGSPLTMDLASMLDPSKTISEEDYERMKKAYGLDKPWPEAYVQWVGNVLRGDMGRSFTRKRPVTGMVIERMGPTLLLSVTSLAITYFLSIPLGLLSRPGLADWTNERRARCCTCCIPFPASWQHCLCSCFGRPGSTVAATVWDGGRSLRTRCQL
ncbi:MAG: ABC transporter permease [Planctomycetaceae bacterium]